MKHFNKAFLTLVCLSMESCADVSTVSTISTDKIWINELNYDNEGGDTNEFIEVVYKSDIVPAGYKLVLYRRGRVYGNPNGYPLDDANTTTIAGNVTLATTRFPPNSLSNASPAGVALISEADEVIQFLSYEGSFVASDGPAVGMETTDIEVHEDSSSSRAYSLQLIGSGCRYSDFRWSDGLQKQTPKAVNRMQTLCGVPDQSIEVLVPDKSLYYEYETVYLRFEKGGRRFQRWGYIDVVSENFTLSDYLKARYSNPVHHRRYRNTDRRGKGWYREYAKRLFVDWDVGKYWVVLLPEVGGRVLARSKDIQVLKNPAVAGKLNKLVYYQGEAISLNFSSTVGVPFRSKSYGDFYVSIVDENGTDEVYNRSNFQKHHSSSLILIFINWDVGRYKAVFLRRRDGNDGVLAVSEVFEVLKNTAVVTTKKDMYYQGEDLVMDFSSTVGVPFQSSDEFVIYNEDLTRVNTSHFDWYYPSSYLDPCGGEIGPNGTMTLRIWCGPGKYKAALRLYGGAVVGASNVFHVKQNPIVLNTSKSVYYQGEDIILNATSTVGVPFQSDDAIEIRKSSCDGSCRNYLQPPYLRPLPDSPSVASATFNIVLEAGFYEFTLSLVDRNNIVAVSNVFQIAKNRAVFDRLEKSVYYVNRDKLILHLTSMSGVPFRKFDIVFIMPAKLENDLCDWTKKEAYTLLFFDDQQLTATVDFSIDKYWDVGSYKAVLCLDWEIPIAISEVFQVKYYPGRR